MAFTVNDGFDGSITEVEFAQLARLLGAPYAADGPDDCKVTVVAGADRTVQIAPGTIYGHGVRSVNDAPITVQLPVIASGTRWDLIAARRDWQPPSGTCVAVSVQGTAQTTLPAGREAEPGVLDDQPLALVQVTAGQTLPTKVVDLRAWPSKVITAASLLAVPDAPLGAEVVIGGRRYRRVIDSTQNLVWEEVLDTNLTATQRWTWGAGAYSWQITGNGAWADPAGASKTIACRAGHEYDFSSVFTVSPANSGSSGPWRASLWVGNTMLREVWGRATSGHPSFPTTLRDTWKCPTTGDYVFKTRAARGAQQYIDNPFAAPFSTVVDLGLRP